MEIYIKPYLFLKIWHLVLLQEERKEGGFLVQFQGPQEHIVLSQSCALPWTGSYPELPSSPATLCQKVQARYPNPAGAVRGEFPLQGYLCARARPGFSKGGDPRRGHSGFPV